MTPTDQFINGLNKIISETKITRAQACRDAGIDPITLRRFLNRETDIKLMTLQAICEKGFGVTFHKVYHLGGE